MFNPYENINDTYDDTIKLFSIICVTTEQNKQLLAALYSMQ